MKIASINRAFLLALVLLVVPAQSSAGVRAKKVLCWVGGISIVVTALVLTAAKWKHLIVTQDYISVRDHVQVVDSDAEHSANRISSEFSETMLHLLQYVKDMSEGIRSLGHRQGA
jgi:hypothetical protein